VEKLKVDCIQDGWVHEISNELRLYRFLNKEKITDDELKYLDHILRNLKSMTSIKLSLSWYETIHLKSDCARSRKITNEGLKSLCIALRELKSLKSINLDLTQ